MCNLICWFEWFSMAPRIVHSYRWLNCWVRQPLWHGWWHHRKCPNSISRHQLHGNSSTIEFLTAGDVLYHPGICFWLFISRMPILLAENYFYYGYYRRDSLTKIVVKLVFWLGFFWPYYGKANCRQFTLFRIDNRFWMLVLWHWQSA